MQNTLTSKRLALAKLSAEDADFIFELVNSPGWLKFIGDRNVRSEKEAGEFIQKIINNPNVNYWVVRIQSQPTPIGIVSFIKRDYLDFYDVGFAFLPRHTGQGFAFEATAAFLQHLARENSYPKILATTTRDNEQSIGLLKKLGFQLDNQIQIDGEELYVHSISMDQFQLNNVAH